jgi:hypothetical protein
MRVDFGVRRQRCGFDEMVLASDQIEHGRQPIIPRDSLTDNFVLLARTDHEAQTLNFAPTRKGSPGELFVAAIGTIQKRSFIKRFPEWFDFGSDHHHGAGRAGLPTVAQVDDAGADARGRGRVCMVAITLFGQSLFWLPAVLPAGLAISSCYFAWRRRESNRSGICRRRSTGTEATARDRPRKTLPSPETLFILRPRNAVDHVYQSDAGDRNRRQLLMRSRSEIAASCSTVASIRSSMASRRCRISMRSRTIR